MSAWNTVEGMVVVEAGRIVVFKWLLGSCIDMVRVQAEEIRFTWHCVQRSHCGSKSLFLCYVLCFIFILLLIHLVNNPVGSILNSCCGFNIFLMDSSKHHSALSHYFLKMKTLAVGLSVCNIFCPLIIWEGPLTPYVWLVITHSNRRETAGLHSKVMQCTRMQRLSLVRVRVFMSWIIILLSFC